MASTTAPQPSRWAHQPRLIRSVVDGLQRHDRGQLIAACGSGKTKMCLRITEKLAAGRPTFTVGIFVPSIHLADQVLSEWLAMADKTLPWASAPLVVCSDASVGRPDDETAAELAHRLGVVVTEDAVVVADHLNQGGPGLVVLVSTYQSACVVSEALAKLDTSLDLLVADEAHHCATRLDSPYAAALHDDAETLVSGQPGRPITPVPARKRLFTTATPRVPKEAKSGELTWAGMDDEALFGPVLGHFSFAEAVDAGVLARPHVVALMVDEDVVAERFGKAGLASTRHVTLPGGGTGRVDDLVRTVAVGKAMAAPDIDAWSMIGFCSSLRRAEEIASAVGQLHSWAPEGSVPSEPVQTAFVSGASEVKDRIEQIAFLAAARGEGRRAFVGNARCLGEGIDIPAVDAVAFLDPKESIVDIVQAAGRAMRIDPAHPAKSAFIVVPVVVKAGQDPHKHPGDFKTVLKVVAALDAHGSTVNRKLAALWREHQAYEREEADRDGGAVGGGTLGGAEGQKIVDPGANDPHNGEPSGGEQAVGGLYTSTSSVTRPRGSIVRRRDGGVDIDTGSVVVSVVGDRRVEARDVADALVAFVVERSRSPFERGLEALRAYVTEHGNADVPLRHATADGYRLGLWLQHQRQVRKIGKLSPERTRQLETLGVVWNPIDCAFELGIETLRFYLAERGTVDVPLRHTTADGFRLGVWLRSRRQDYKVGRLTPERVRRLEAIGVVWNLLDVAFERGLEALRAYVTDNGDADVPKHYRSPDGFRLGAWLRSRRQDYKVGRLTPERVCRLEAIGVVWEQHEAAFKHGLDALRAYVTEHGDADVLCSYTTPDGFRLGSWLSTRRKDYKAGKLALDRIRQLEELGVRWRIPNPTRFRAPCTEQMTATVAVCLG